MQGQQAETLGASTGTALPHLAKASSLSEYSAGLHFSSCIRWLKDETTNKDFFIDIHNLPFAKI